MNEITKPSSTIDDIILFENKEWPFEGYAREINNLRKYFGQKMYINYGGYSGINARKKQPMGYIEISPRFINPSLEDSLFPHSLVFIDGSAINMNEVLYVCAGEDGERLSMELCPYFKISLLIKDVPERDCRLLPCFEVDSKSRNEAEEILKQWYSEDVVYKNPVLVTRYAISAKISQRRIHNMTERAAAMGMFDQF